MQGARAEVIIDGGGDDYGSNRNRDKIIFYIIKTLSMNFLKLKDSVKNV